MPDYIERIYIVKIKRPHRRLNGLQVPVGLIHLQPTQACIEIKLKRVTVETAQRSLL